MTESTNRGEVRTSAIIVGAALVAFVAVLLLVPSFFESYDEAKYLGIARSMWAGLGPLTVFGQTFTPHAPGWPVIIGAPQALIGLDALTVGRALNAVAAVALIVMAAWFGWRIRPLAGALTACVMLAFIYLMSQTRTARLDVPAAALSMAYLIVGLAAIRRGSARWGIAAGVVFAIGFLVKEIDLPLLPVPLVAGLLAGRPWRRVGWSMGFILAISVVGISPWIWYFATLSHQVYRLGVSDAWLGPIAAGVVALCALGIASPWLAGRRVGQGIEAFLGRTVGQARLRLIVGWGLVAIWTLVQLYGYVKTSRLAGHPIIDLTQLRLYLREWAVWMSPITVFCAVGVLAALVLLWRRRGTPAAEPLRDLLLAAICGAPLVFLVVVVGEPPRNYISSIALATALAAGGWIALLETMAARSSAAGAAAWGALGLVAGLGLALPAHLRLAGGLVLGAVLAVAAAGAVLAIRRTGRERWLGLAPIAVTLAVLVGGAGELAAYGWLSRDPAGGAARAEAQGAIVSWVRANVPAGSTVAFGNFLSQELGYSLVGTFRLRQITARIAISDPAAPDGLILNGEPAGGDWIAVDTAPRNVNEFQAFRATWLVRSFQATGATYWVYVTGISTSAPMIEDALKRATGFSLAAEWTFPVRGASPLHVSIYRVTPAQVAFDAAHISITPEALDRLVGLIRHAPGAAAVAARLELAVVLVPPGPAADAALKKLHALAGQ